MSNVSEAARIIRSKRSIRLDELNRLGVSEKELGDELEKEGFGFITRNYSGGGPLGEDDPSADPDPESVYLDLERMDDE